MLAHKRLQRELVALQREPPQFIRARPSEDDVLTFYYVIEGPPNSPYKGGHYLGALKFPPEYPLKPPAVYMYTPNGRFAENTALCLSMSSFHPETWNPVWSVSTILVGLLSFMLESTPTMGSVETTAAAKQRLAAESLAWNVAKGKDFAKTFPELVELHASRQAAAAAVAAAATEAARGTSSGADGVAGGPGGDGAAGAAAAAAAPAAVKPAAAAGAGGLLDGSNGFLILVLLAAAIVWAYLQQQHDDAGASHGRRFGGA